MITEMKPRQYRLKKRAERQDETRARIVEATVALHEAVGPARTTISAIAEKAGVERLTVYRHFPDETSLFTACSGHFLAAHPPPDPTAWAGVTPADARTRAALGALYPYYRQVEPMFASILGDVARMPGHRDVLVGGYEAYLAGVRKDLLAAWKPDRRSRRLAAGALGHALRFETWRSLAHEGLGDAAIVTVVAGMIRTAAR